MFKSFFIFVLRLLLLCRGFLFESDFCYRNGDESCDSSHSDKMSSKYFNKRYLLYDVNPGEGFNLRRDVYMRIATLVKKLNQDDTVNEWILVLPPWGRLYHWKSKHLGFQTQIKWSKFFDIPSLAKYVPVLEFEDFLSDHGSTISMTYYLQHYAEGWTNDRWEERIDIRECIEPPPYRKVKNKYVGWFWGYDDVYSEKFHCLSVQGYSSTLKKKLISSGFSAVMIDRAEVILHDTFGDSEYWMVRRSMVFSKKLIHLADSFRKLYLNSTDIKDKTVKKYDQFYSFNRSAVGGPYLAVHLRRQDFASARPKEVPSIKHAAHQILTEMKKWNLDLLFVATDAPHSEFLELQQYIPKAVRFIPDKNIHEEILDGGVAIVDQWICAHARFFIGTYESTFSFRIQEEREILRFPIETTFNRLCGDNQTTCEQPAKWTIVI